MVYSCRYLLSTIFKKKKIVNVILHKDQKDVRSMGKREKQAPYYRLKKLQPFISSCIKCEESTHKMSILIVSMYELQIFTEKINSDKIRQTDEFSFLFLRRSSH